MPANATVERSGKLRWYQFSLRSLMVVVALFAILCSIVTVVMQRNERYWRSPCLLSGGPSYDRNRGEYQHIDCVVSRDHYKDYYYGAVVGYVDFDANLEETHWSYSSTYGGNEGGILKVNDKIVEYSTDKRLLTVNPFGKVEEVVLSPAEQKVACSADGERIWNQIVLKRLYKRQGKTEAGVPVGHWIYSDAKSRLAYEGSYKHGKRDGKWTYYHEDGSTRAEMVYSRGELDGECRYFDNQGNLKKTVKWKNGYPVDQTVRQIGIGCQEVRTPMTTSEGSK
jgi:hypothetical protein